MTCILTSSKVKVAEEGSVVARIREEEMILLPDRAMFWPAQSTLFVADIHLGKGSAFRAGAIPVPTGVTKGTLNRLCAVVRENQPSRIVILGDLWHARAGRTEQSEAEFMAWRERHSTREVWLIEGNHDLKSGELPSAHDLRVLPSGTRLGPFALLHEPCEPEEGYGLAGHLHPGARLVGRGDSGLTAPCFWVRPEYTVLPAFGEFTGTARIRPTTADRVYVVTTETVLEV